MNADRYYPSVGMQGSGIDYREGISGPAILMLPIKKNVSFSCKRASGCWITPTPIFAYLSPDSAKGPQQRGIDGFDITCFLILEDLLLRRALTKRDLTSALENGKSPHKNIPDAGESAPGSLHLADITTVGGNHFLIPVE
ncbi:hypothetical protein [Pectobacterium brasiliense]|uniref:hypothetical protein n=1 Tax=Pectobacterium brasiliense TaxID=180957 RepID=UPI001C60425F|nr:hypothetical protein [Pectobacterium brasiliense]